MLRLSGTVCLPGGKNTNREDCAGNGEDAREYCQMKDYGKRQSRSSDLNL